MSLIHSQVRFVNAGATLLSALCAFALAGCPSEVTSPTPDASVSPTADAGSQAPSRCPECELCNDEQAIDEQVEAGRLTFESLTTGLPEQPILGPRPEATNGTLTKRIG